MDSPLSEVDRKILKQLLTPLDGISSKSISEKTGIPLSTIQRRRGRLERDYVETTTRLRLEKFGWRRISMLISTGGGASQAIGKELLTRSGVTSVARTIGEHTIDLIVEAFVKDNGELLDFQEFVKGMSGVKDAMWTEVIEIIGTKSPPNHILSGTDETRGLRERFRRNNSTRVERSARQIAQ